MEEFSYIVKSAHGLHARPAGGLAQTAMGFKSDIFISCHGKKVDAKRILGIMGLGVKENDEILIQAEGEDEKIAISELKRFAEGNL